MNKILIFVILAIVVLSGCKTNQNIEESVYSPKTIEFCRTLEYKLPEYSLIPDNIICYINYAKANGTSINCNQQEKMLCDMGIAVHDKNTSFCDNYFCYLGFGLNADNISVCNSFNEDGNRTCILGFAIKNDNADLCEVLVYEENVTDREPGVFWGFAAATDTKTISNFMLKETCYFEIAKKTKNENSCGFLNSYLKEDCYYVLAIEKGDIGLCDEAGDNRIDCKRKLSFEKAVKNENILDCAVAGDFDYDMADCVIRIAVAKKDESVCEQLPRGFGSVQDDCYNKVALAKGDIKLCEKAEISACYENLSSPETYEICGNMSSQNAALQCYVNSLCKTNRIESNCREELEKKTSEITARALNENNSSLCEGLGNLKPFCYFNFVRDLDFSPSDVFKYELFGQGEDLCEKLKGKVRTKCFFNLAIKDLDEGYCAETESYVKRCAENVFLLKRNLTRDQLMNAVRSRITDQNGKLGIKESGLDNAWEGFNGHSGNLDVYNDGFEKLEGTKFELYKNFRLVDIDGCKNNPVIFPKRQTSEDEWDVRHCILEFNTPSQGHSLEVTYNGKTVFVDHD